MMIFRLNVHKIRYWIWLEKVYDPDCRNVDQSPSHKNEAGSKAFGTVVMRVTIKVPPIENRAVARDRYSLSTVTDCSEDRIKKELPGFELMFKTEVACQGEAVAATCRQVE